MLRGRAYIEVIDTAASDLTDALRMHETPLRVRQLPVIAKDEVLGQVELQHETALVPVLGDVRYARRDRVPRRAARDVAPEQFDPA
jgi:uncharacterized protein with PhoU and TrkA domain